MHDLDQHILEDQWRPNDRNRVNGKAASLRRMVDDLITTYGQGAVAARLGVDIHTPPRWVNGVPIKDETCRAAIVAWWGEREAASIDDGLIHAVQALRIIERTSETTGTTIRLVESTRRLDEINQMSTRAIKYLSKHIASIA